MSATRNRASGQVRIISGKWRGRKLPVLQAEGLRPTTDRTKETVFNWLMQDVRDARCLDAFAGAGSLGLEALSRGAAELVVFEQDKRAVQSLKANCQTLKAEAKIHCGNSLELIKQQTQGFDIVFIDPPFRQNLLLPFIHLLLSRNLLNPDACMYLEHEAELTIPDLSPLHLHREKNASQFRYALYRL